MDGMLTPAADVFLEVLVLAVVKSAMGTIFGLIMNHVCKCILV